VIELHPSRIFVALYLAALLAVSAGVFFSSLSGVLSALILLITLFLAVYGVVSHWRSHRGTLIWASEQATWLGVDGSQQPVVLGRATGWSDWILRLELREAEQGRIFWPWRGRYLMVMSDNCQSEAFRQLRVHLLSRNG
jgi:hypothetical protein